MLQKWRNLLSSIEIVSGNLQRVLSQEELEAYEVERGIVLPEAYKDYCQVFGEGIFGDAIRIYCPSNYFYDSSRSLIESLMEDLNTFLDNSERKNWLEKLLKSALIFGDDFGANVALWDLKSYKEIDHSYDIYWVSIDIETKEDCHLVGRDFFEFIEKFCLGTRSRKVLPEEKWQQFEQIPHTFTSFSSLEI